ncbi:hypothetical protein C8Q72DRAFT_863852 [Fomitopsis betulina]|nr:hypothetical protein C8Q72DRAFT_863852 [Fomitopsis betulina]
MRFASLLVFLSTLLASVAVAWELPCMTTQGCIARDDSSHATGSGSLLFARNGGPSGHGGSSGGHSPGNSPPPMSLEETVLQIWNKMKNHVLRGRPDKLETGRHTTSSFFAYEAKHGHLAPSLIVNAQTSFAKLSKKTMFVDSVVRRCSATNSVKKWSQGTIGAACKSAIHSALIAAGSGKAMKSGSYSVRSPLGGPNLCVYVNYASCWPSGITPTSKPPGQPC